MNSSFSKRWESFKELLTYDHEAVESLVGSDEALTRGLQPQALYSSPEDMQRIFSSELVKGTFVDLGCGIGIPSLVYGLLFSDRESIGVDVSSSRLDVALGFKNKLGLSNCQFFQGDLSRMDIPKGQGYFLYFPTGPILDRLLSELYLRRGEFVLIAIESHGDLFSRLAKEPWLTLSEEVPLSSKRHEPMARIYTSTKKQKLPSLHDHSFRDAVLMIREGDSEWLGDSLGLEWIGGDFFNLKYPPRTIDAHQVFEVKEKAELSDLLLYLISWRRLGELYVEHENGNALGFIRKIILGPSFSLEISTGEKIEWESVKTISWGDKLCYDSSSHFYFLPLVH